MVLWRTATAVDAEWMSGKSRTLLALGLDGGFLMEGRLDIPFRLGMSKLAAMV
jgi:hypothetical protein